MRLADRRLLHSHSFDRSECTRSIFHIIAIIKNSNWCILSNKHHRPEECPHCVHITFINLPTTRYLHVSTSIFRSAKPKRNEVFHQLTTKKRHRFIDTLARGEQKKIIDNQFSAVFNGSIELPNAFVRIITIDDYFVFRLCAPWRLRFVMPDWANAIVSELQNRSEFGPICLSDCFRLFFHELRTTDKNSYRTIRLNSMAIIS